uniref:Lcl domain-containing protein n=1 Tax=Mariniflexile sp. TaxID=1979402 RepID=UPI004047E35B
MKNKGIIKVGILIIVLVLFSACGSERNKKQSQSEQVQKAKRSDGPKQEAGHERPSVTEMLAEMDSDGDGKLAESEVKGPLKNDFSKIDTDKDGFITVAEFNKAPKPQGDSSQGRPQGGGKELPTVEEVLATIKSSKNSKLKVLAKNYVLTTTGQVHTYNAVGKTITDLKKGNAFYGQDGNYQKGQKMSYTDNGDRTITDNVTGLIWAKDQSTESQDWTETDAYCKNLNLGGYSDWRMPTIKELWSITDKSTGWPYINTNYFNLVSKDGAEQRDQHTWSSNFYLVNTPESKKRVAFIVNDWTGHIKALDGRRYVRAVRGGAYGINDFVDNGNNTITDKATGLMWSKDDSKKGMNWEAALAYAENSDYAEYSDWRLPNVKELQSIVDYSGKFPAIDTSFFNLSKIKNEAGNADYPYFWTSTSAGSEKVSGMYFAYYVAFGYAVDQQGNDIHGAGAVRFDTKVKNGPAVPNEERINNYVRLVRDIN